MRRRNLRYVVGPISTIGALFVTLACQQAPKGKTHPAAQPPSSGSVINKGAQPLDGSIEAKQSGSFQWSHWSPASLAEFADKCVASFKKAFPKESEAKPRRVRLTCFCLAKQAEFDYENHATYLKKEDSWWERLGSQYILYCGNWAKAQEK